MCDDPLLEAKQDPVGCRFIHGHPGDGVWFYCQRPIAEGGRIGSLEKPPYCKQHLARTREHVSESKLRARHKFLERIAQSEETMMYDNRGAFWNLVPVDMFIKGRVALQDGALKHD